MKLLNAGVNPCSIAPAATDLKAPFESNSPSSTILATTMWCYRSGRVWNGHSLATGSLALDPKRTLDAVVLRAIVILLRAFVDPACHLGSIFGASGG